MLSTRTFLNIDVHGDGGLYIATLYERTVAN